MLSKYVVRCISHTNNENSWNTFKVHRYDMYSCIPCSNRMILPPSNGMQLIFETYFPSKIWMNHNRRKIYIHYVTLHYITLHYIAFHYTESLFCITYSHCIALHYITLHYIAFYYIESLFCITLSHCIALHCISSHCIALYCIALHWVIVLHYI